MLLTIILERNVVNSQYEYMQYIVTMKSKNFVTADQICQGITAITVHLPHQKIQIHDVAQIF